MSKDFSLMSKIFYTHNPSFTWAEEISLMKTEFFRVLVTVFSLSMHKNLEGLFNFSF